MPTIAQAGMPEYEATGWNGVPAPANTPRPIVDKFDKTAVEARKTPEIGKFLMEQGLEPAGNSPQQFVRSMHSNMEKWLRSTREAASGCDRCCAVLHICGIFFSLLAGR